MTSQLVPSAQLLMIPLRLWNLFNMDVKGAERSVHIMDVSVLWR